MKKYLSLLLILFSCLCSFAQTKFVTTTNLNMRRLPCTCSDVVTVIPKGSTVSVLNYEDNNWARVNWNGKTFYASRKYLKQKKENNYSGNYSGNVRHYYNKYGERVQSPTYYQTAPAGATALCRDGTYSFSRSRRGTCSHHGGVAKWL